jgi:Flp pilus assembly protein TadG
MATMQRGMRVGRRLKGSESGSQLVEAGLGLTVFCALLFLVVDTGWGVFVKATLQHAVAEGVRYGVTGKTSGALGQTASIVAVVQLQAMGLLNGSQASTIAVTFYDPNTLAQTSSNAGGNILKVSVEGYQFTPLAPLLRSAAPISITASATDIIESSPGGVAPPI